MYVYVLLFSFSHAFLGRLLLAEETQSITDDTGRKKKNIPATTRETRIQGSRRPRGGTTVRAARPLDLSYKSESSFVNM